MNTSRSGITQIQDKSGFLSSRTLFKDTNNTNNININNNINIDNIEEINNNKVDIDNCDKNIDYNTKNLNYTENTRNTGILSQT